MASIRTLVAAAFVAAASSVPAQQPIAPVDFRPFSDGMHWIVRQPLVYRIGVSQDTVTVPVGFVTDFASIPQALQAIIRANGPYILPAVVHDYLYWKQSCTREQADRILLLGMIENEVREIHRIAIHDALVRLATHPGFDVRDNALRVFGARVVRRHDRQIGHPYGQLAHGRAFAGVAIAAGAKDDDQLAGLLLRRRRLDAAVGEDVCAREATEISVKAETTERDGALSVGVRPCRDDVGGVLVLMPALPVSNRGHVDLDGIPAVRCCVGGVGVTDRHLVLGRLGRERDRGEDADDGDQHAEPG